MGDIGHSLGRYDNRAVGRYGDYYESEETTLKSIWRRFFTAMKSRYKILIDSSARQRRRAATVRTQLKEVGLRGLDLIKPEVFYISSLLRSDEKVKAAVCGHIEDGSSVLLVITEKRFLYLNVIPFFTTVEEIGLSIIEAVSMSIGPLDATVNLYTGVGNFNLSNVSVGAASRLVEMVETIIETNQSPSAIIK